MILNYFKDTNFDFDRIKYLHHNGFIYVDAYYILRIKFVQSVVLTTILKMVINPKL